MFLALLVILGMLLQVAVTNPVYNTQDEDHIAYDNHQDPFLWEKSGQFEGDIILTPEQEENLYSENVVRNGIIDAKMRWPNQVIPYVISDDFTEIERNYIERTVKEDFGRTCVKVVPRTNQVDYIYVTGKDTGCSSYLGRFGGKQIINLQRNGCLVYGTIVHEFLHAAGFYHMHSATERDDFVTIEWDNIQSGKQNNFNKYSATIINNFGQPYDYGSLLHFSAFAFSKNGKNTVVPKQNVQIGLASRLSSIDIIRLNRMYKC